MRKWRVRVDERDGRYYPEFTEDEGTTWRRHYTIVQKNGYAREHYARKYVADYLDGTRDEWWQERTPAEVLGAETVAALRAKFEGRQDELQDDMATSEQIKFERRAEFVKWLIEHGRIGEGDMASEDTREVVQPGLLGTDK